MSAQQLFVKAKEFTPSTVTYDEPQTNKRGGKSVNIRLNGQPIVLQVPLMLTWGVNEWVDEGNGSVKYDMALQFDPQTSSSQTKFLSAMKEFQEKVSNDAVTNCKKWFGKQMSREVIDALMYPMLKYRKDKATGEPDYTANPTMKLKVPFWEGRFNVEIYGMDREALYLPPKFGKGAEGNQAPNQDPVSTPLEFVPKASHIKGLIRCNGMWFAGGKCGVTFQLVQVQVRPPTRLVGSGNCHIIDDSDDDEIVEDLKKKDEATKIEDEYSNHPTFDDDDDDDEVVEEVVEVVEEVEEVPKKKKKIVRRKKIKSDA
tara:strand:+ start:1251 stop:2192 length:942 start_codon:yes stop_codon:yes gene_type:complete